MPKTPEFKYAPMFQLGEDKTEYRLLTKEGVSVGDFEGHPMLKVSKEALTLLAQQAFHDVEFMLRREHNEQVAAILRDPEASENDKYVALQFLRNAEVACKGVLPFCQDTGTAIIHGEKGQQVWTGFEDEEALSLGVFNTFTEDNLRYSQNAPLNMYDEVNTRCNLPAQIDIEAVEGMEYRFVMVAKGGGSANKTYFYPMTKATIQNESTLLPFLVEKMKSLGTAACPPYHIAFVIGGTSAEKNLLTVKLASIKFYDNLPTTGDETGRAFRDIDLENKLLEEAHKIGLGAQFGGKHLAHDIRVVRLPRHGASCPIGMGVSCSADRNIKAKINADGVWLEKMDDNPTELIPAEYCKPGEGAESIVIDLDKGIDAVRAELTKYPVSTRVNLKGTIIVARDIAHAKLKARLDAGEEMPAYFKDHPILYAGPAKTPEGYPCGSMGPTTANRMDPYVDEFQDHGASLVMIAKGNRTQAVTDACQKHGGFYLGSIGGVAAVLSQSSIKSIECVEYPELGMEAIWKIVVEDFPAFILVDDKGNDFFKQLNPCGKQSSVASSVGVSDYIPYNPNALQVIAEKDGKYLLTDGRSRMKMFANREDAYNGMRIAMRHNLQCFVGRNNKRAERKDYIFEFWAGTSGLTNQPLTKTDLIGYNPNNLTAVSMGSSGWSIRDGNHWMFIADNEADAKAIISVLKNYTKVGFIGRDNKQPDRKNYIMTYLE